MNLSTLLLVFAFSTVGTAFGANPCGLTGKAKERIYDCATKKEFWSLVSRNAEGFEVWLDHKTMLLWGDIDPRPSSSQARAENNCLVPNQSFNAGLKGTFHLPSIERVAQVLHRSIPFQNMNSTIWTRTRFAGKIYKQDIACPSDYPRNVQCEKIWNTYSTKIRVIDIQPHCQDKGISTWNNLPCIYTVYYRDKDEEWPSEINLETNEGQGMIDTRCVKELGSLNEIL